MWIAGIRYNRYSDRVVTNDSLQRKEHEVRHVVYDPLWQGGKTLTCLWRQRQLNDDFSARRIVATDVFRCVCHLSQEELCDGGEKNEAALKDVRVEKADVGASFGFAQFLKSKQDLV